MEPPRALPGGLTVVIVTVPDSSPPRQVLEIQNYLQEVLRVDTIFEPAVGGFVYNTLGSR